MEEEIKPNKKGKRKFVLKLIIVVILIMCIFGIFYITSYLSKPVTNDVTSSLGTINSNYYNIDLTPVNMAGKNISFNHPKGVPLESKSLISPISVEDYIFFAKNISSWTLAIDIIQTPTGNLNESSSYNFRKITPAKYTESTVTSGGKSYDVMTENAPLNGYGKVAYYSHNNLIAIISLSGNDAKGSAPLDTTFDMVLSSMKWN